MAPTSASIALPGAHILQIEHCSDSPQAYRALDAGQQCAAHGDESVDNSQCGGKVGDRAWMNLVDPHSIHIFRMLVDGSASPRRGSAHDPDRRPSTPHAAAEASVRRAGFHRRMGAPPPPPSGGRRSAVRPPARRCSPGRLQRTAFGHPRILRARLHDRLASGTPMPRPRAGEQPVGEHHLSRARPARGGAVLPRPAERPCARRELRRPQRLSCASLRSA